LIIYSENGFFICGINILKQYHNSTFGRYGTMANQNFVVHNGLTVGQTTIWAGNGDVTISGNITVAGNITVTGQSTFTGQQTIGGQVDASLADATSLAIALGG
jgi:hypothetical protein